MSGYDAMGEERQGAERLKEEAKQKGGEVVEQAKQKGGEVVEQTRTRAFDMVDQQKSRAAEGLGGVASALRQTGDSLRMSDQGQFGQYAERAAEVVERLSDDLRNKDVNELLYEAERFARREPELFLGGAVLLGLIAARFMKASNRRSMRGMQDYGRSRYEYGDRFSGYGAGQYGGEIDYRSTGAGGYASGGSGSLSGGSGSYGGSGSFSASGSMGGGSGSYTGSTSGSGSFGGSGSTGSGSGSFGSSGSTSGGSSSLGSTGAAGASSTPSPSKPKTTGQSGATDSKWTGDSDDPARKANSSQS